MWSFQTEGGGTKLERFYPKYEHTKRKLLNFGFWINGELSKSTKIWLLKSIFYVKNRPNCSHFFSMKIMYRFRSTFFDKINYSITLLLKWCPIFDRLSLFKNSKFNNFLLVCWFLCQKLSNFVPPFENSATRIAITLTLPLLHV